MTRLNIGDYVKGGEGEDFDFGQVLETGPGPNCVVRWDGSVTRCRSPTDGLIKITHAEWLNLRAGE